MNIHFTHKIIVPIGLEHIKAAGGYIDEIAGASEFEFSQAEYAVLRKNGSVYDAFDKVFQTIIADCEEELIDASKIEKAIEIVKSFSDKATDDTELTALRKLKEALQCANDRSVYCVIVGGIDISE